MSLVFRSASALPASELAELFTAAYEDYVVPFAMTEEQLRTMVDAYDLDLDASAVLYAADRPVGLCNLGRRGDRGWIGGVGVVKDERRRGHGRLLMEYVHGVARAQGVRSMSLEVIVENEGARRLYERLGYRITRQLEVWTLAEGTGNAREVPWEDAHRRVRELRDEPEPWQRSDETVHRFDRLRGLETDAGAAVVRVEDGRAQLLQIAGGDAEELVGAGAALAALSALNLPAGGAAAEAFRALGGTLVVRQHELVLDLI